MKNIEIPNSLYSFSLSKQIGINPFVTQSSNTKLTFSLGNSWCNLISWKIMRLIETEELNTKYTFLHIPSSFNLNRSVRIVENIIIGEDVNFQV